MATVYITNQHASMLAATVYGNLSLITMGEYNVADISRLYSQINKALIFSKDTDYLLCLNSPNIAALCVAVWLELHPIIQMLIWDQPNNKFIVHTLMKSQIRSDIERTKDELSRVLLRDSDRG